MIQTKLPEESGDYKVVQLEMDGSQYVQFHERRGHANILTALLEKEGNRYTVHEKYGPRKIWEDRRVKPDEIEHCLAYETVPDLTDQETKIPSLRGEMYNVLGMGRARVDGKSKTVVFYGTSMSYGIGLDLEQLTELQKEKPEWQIEK